MLQFELMYSIQNMDRYVTKNCLSVLYNIRGSLL